MPIFVVNTNVAKDAVPAELLTEATQQLAKAMGKPAQVSTLHFSHVPQIVWLFILVCLEYENVTVNH